MMWAHWCRLIRLQHTLPLSCGHTDNHAPVPVPGPAATHHPARMHCMRWIISIQQTAELSMCQLLPGCQGHSQISTATDEDCTLRGVNSLI
jgi:hypothetical protein